MPLSTRIQLDRPALSPVIAGCWRMADWGWTPMERLRWIEGSLLFPMERPAETAATVQRLIEGMAQSSGAGA